MQQQVQCSDCNGEGVLIREKDKCTDCRGKKATLKKTKLELNIENGIYEGNRVSFQGEGDQPQKEIEAGDIILEIVQKRNSYFTRKGADLIYKMNITLLEALTGFKKTIDFLDGKKVLVSNEAGSILKPGNIRW
jgi:DnaJ-class molecular chaperone